MEITVFGPGCARCAEAENLVKEVASARGPGITVRKVSDFKEMMAAGVMSTPAVAIDGVLKCTGRVPDRKELEAWIGASQA
ncbi:thioredoxin family protein [Desulfovibrio sp. OttesenSCG-928-C14]|nr:thioredoxin family protein [Desulfovibrio sp. OttesenSCG-928-C14]